LNGGPLFCTSEAKVIVPGNLSVSETLAAAEGPEFVTMIEYETSVSAIAEAGPVFTTETSACGEGMVVVPVDESFSSLGSKVAVDTLAMFVNVVPAGVAGGIFATKVKLALDPAVKRAFVQVIVPFAPTLGVEQLNAGPLFCVAETNVIPGGKGSVSDTVVASSGPKLETVTSNGTSLPAVAFAGAFLKTARSAVVAAPAGLIRRAGAPYITGAMTKTRAKKREVLLIFTEGRLQQLIECCEISSLRISHSFIGNFPVINIDALG
jgi:hypothetical protein